MKRPVLLSALLLLIVSLPAPALENASRKDDRSASTLVDDVIRMTESGVGEEEIVVFVKNARDQYDISADDVIALNDARVSKSVIRTVISEAADRTDVRPERRRTTARSYYVAPAYTGWYDPWYSPFSYSPWYSGYGYGYGYWPHVSIGVGFGPRYHGRHFRRR